MEKNLKSLNTSSAPFTLYSKNVDSLKSLKTLAGKK